MRGGITNIRFVNGENVKNDNIIVSSEDGALRFKSGRYFRIALRDINKLTVKFFSNVSDLNLSYFLKTSLPSSLERLFYKNISNNEEYINIYCYGKHTKFSNDCIRWFIYNISKNVGEFFNICHEYETYVEL